MASPEMLKHSKVDNFADDSRRPLPEIISTQNI